MLHLFSLSSLSHAMVGYPFGSVLLCSVKFPSPKSPHMVLVSYTLSRSVLVPAPLSNQITSLASPRLNLSHGSAPEPLLSALEHVKLGLL